jgi:hypothetical protein
MAQYPFMERGRSEPAEPRELGRDVRIAAGLDPDFRDAPSPHASKPGEPPQMWPLSDPDYYRNYDDLRPARGILLGLPLGLALWALIVWLVVW